MIPDPPKVIAVDVDGTLNPRLIEWLRGQKTKGFKLMLWSSGGEEHAMDAAVRFGAVELFDLICSKPGYIIDDQGWGWIKYTKVIRRFNEITTD